MADLEFKASERFITSILDASPNLIYVYDIVEQRNLYANREVTHFLGYTPEQIEGLGSRLFEIILHPDDAAAVARHHARMREARDDDAFDVEYRMKHSSGQWRWLRSRDVAFARGEDGAVVQILGFTEDITERKLAEGELRRAHAILQAAIDQSPVGIAIADAPDGRLRYANDAGLLIRGLDRQIAIDGISMAEYGARGELLDVDGTPLKHDELPLVRAIALGEKCARQIIARRTDGDDRVLLANAAPITDDSGEVVAGIVVFTDITDRMRSEEALERSQLLLESSLECQKDTILFSIDRDYRYLLYNKAHIDVMKSAYGRDIELGMCILDCITSDDDRVVAKENYDRALAGESHTNVRVFGDVHLAYYESFFNPIVNDRGEIIGATGLARDITERKRAEQALGESEDKFRYMFEHSIVAKSLTKPGGEIDVNDAFCEMLGYTREEMSERATWQQLTHPEDVARTEEAVAALLSGEIESARFEKRYLRKDGEVVWADMSTSLRRNAEGEPEYFMTTIVDITERKEAEQERADNEARLQAILDNAPYGAHMYELDGDRLVFTGYNRQAEKILGLDHAPLLGHTLEEAFPGNVGTDTPDAYRRVAREGGTWDVEQYSYDAEGIAGVFEVYAFSFGPNRVSVFFQDITERKRAEAEVLRLNAELEERVQERTEELHSVNEELQATNEDLSEANVKLAEATRAKSEFLAAMSHELRTPLNSIIGFSGILSQGLPGSLNEEQRKQIGMINNSGRHLLELINEVLDLAKIESGQSTPDIQEVDVGAVAREMFDTVRPMAEAKGIEMRFACPDGLAPIRTDGHYVNQILLNLLGNAVKFTEGGYISATVTPDGSGVGIAIEDSGCGISAESLERIFDDFYQVAPHSSAESEGTGLGLAVSRRLAESIGGRIDVASELGTGSVFTLRIPEMSS